MDYEYKKAAEFIEKRLAQKASIALILGSGLGALADNLDSPVYIDYSDVPGFPKSTVAGHNGRLVCGKLNGVNILAMQGRFHYYEGYDMRTITFPVRVMKLLGTKKLIVTNAAGGVNKAFGPGDLMLISDHIKLVADTPLRGQNDDSFGPRFNDMSEAYSKELIRTAKAASAELGIKLQSGTYMFMPGPSYETPAEINAARVLGADAVGMSTVPEVITANHCGIKVLGISCITNMAAGILDQPLDHSEVMITAEKARENFISLISLIVKIIGNTINA